MTVNRGVRVLGVLESLERDVEDYFDMPDWQRERFDDRTIHKDELLEICDRLGIETNGETRDEVLQLVRSDARIATPDDPPQRLNKSELLSISRFVRHESFAEADDIGRLDVKSGGDIWIDGESYRVIGVEEGDVDDGWDPKPYDSYQIVNLKGRKRLALLFGWVPDRCKYNHSAILEQAVDHGIYKRWVKDSYVEEVIVSRSGVVGSICVRRDEPASQLREHGVLTTFRARVRTTGETWWKSEQYGTKEDDVTVKILDEVSPFEPGELDPYVDRSGFASVDDWRDAIEETYENGDKTGYIYEVKTR